MTTALNALQAHQQIEEFAQSAPTEKRIIPDGSMPPGKWIRQGDIYLVAIESIPLENDVETHNRQLAPGETRGSRHVVEGNVRLFIKGPNQRVDTLEGPALISKERITIVHPEHAHFELPAGAYQSYYQMDARQAERTRSLD